MQSFLGEGGDGQSNTGLGLGAKEKGYFGPLRGSQLDAFSP